MPSSAVDDITRAQQEAAAAGYVKSRYINIVTFAENVSDADQPQFKLAIRSEPIQEDDPDAQSAFSSVANTLRAVSFGVRCLLLKTYADRTSKHRKLPHLGNRVPFEVVGTSGTLYSYPRANH